jgi:hypothetical protein
MKDGNVGSATAVKEDAVRLDDLGGTIWGKRHCCNFGIKMPAMQVNRNDGGLRSVDTKIHVHLPDKVSCA